MHGGAARCGHASACTNACIYVHAHRRVHLPSTPRGVLWLCGIIWAGCTPLLLAVGWQGCSEPWEQQVPPESCGIHSFVLMGEMSPSTRVPACTWPLVPWSQTLPHSRVQGLPASHPRALPLFALPKAWAGAQGRDQESDEAALFHQGPCAAGSRPCCISCLSRRAGRAPRCLQHRPGVEGRAGCSPA